jgi:hypothetical protein
LRFVLRGNSSIHQSIVFEGFNNLYPINTLNRDRAFRLIGIFIIPAAAAANDFPGLRWDLWLRFLCFFTMKIPMAVFSGRLEMSDPRDIMRCSSWQRKTQLHFLTRVGRDDHLNCVFDSV